MFKLHLAFSPYYFSKRRLQLPSRSLFPVLFIVSFPLVLPLVRKAILREKVEEEDFFSLGFSSSLTISFITRTICIKKQETVIRCYCEAKMVWERDISVHKNGFMRVCSKNGISFFYSASSSSQAKRRTTGSEINLSEKLKKTCIAKYKMHNRILRVSCFSLVCCQFLDKNTRRAHARK